MSDAIERAAFYLWAASPEQPTGLQFGEFAYIADRAGWRFTEYYKDVGSERAKFDRMLQDAARRRFDVLMAWSIDRLGRNLPELVRTLAALNQAGIDLYLKEQEIDTTTPSGRTFFEAIGILAEFERAKSRERVHDGLDRARAAGKRFGRPRLAPERIEAIRADLAGGLSIRKAAQDHGVGISTVQRLKNGTWGPQSEALPAGTQTDVTQTVVAGPVHAPATGRAGQGPAT